MLCHQARTNKVVTFNDTRYDMGIQHGSLPKTFLLAGASRKRDQPQDCLCLAMFFSRFVISHCLAVSRGLKQKWRTPTLVYV